MKFIFLTLIYIFSAQAFAHEIVGTPVLEGSLKTQTLVDGLKVSCRIKIDDVKNLMKEDKFGNPAYKLSIAAFFVEMSFLSGRVFRYERKAELTNMFSDGVRDFEYQGDNWKMFIKPDGRLEKVVVPHPRRELVCLF
jgi:hypothetical protein